MTMMSTRSGVRVEAFAYETMNMAQSRALGIKWQEYDDKDRKQSMTYGLWRGFYVPSFTGYTAFGPGDWLVIVEGDMLVISGETLDALFVRDVSHEEKERMDDDGCPNVERT